MQPCQEAELRHRLRRGDLDPPTTRGCPMFRRRKKDHGRAEALVLAAYALGVRMQPLGGDSKAGEGAAQDEEDDDDARRAGIEGEEEEEEESE